METSRKIQRDFKKKKKIFTENLQAIESKYMAIIKEDRELTLYLKSIKERLIHA